MSNLGVEPNATLYIKNIDWKVKKGLLRRALYSLFTRHGKVLDIITLRKDGLRGQAFVIMDSVQAATAALNAEQGYTFFNKDMVIEYAHTKSDMIAKRDGDYVPKAQRLIQKRKMITNTTDNPSDSIKVEMEETEPTAVMAEASQVSDDASILESLSSTPTCTLVAYQLPAECNETMLHILFQQYAGYQPPVRMMLGPVSASSADPQPPYGIVEFDTEPNASLAYQALNGFQLSTQEKLQLTYMKKNV